MRSAGAGCGLRPRAAEHFRVPVGARFGGVRGGGAPRLHTVAPSHRRACSAPWGFRDRPSWVPLPPPLTRPQQGPRQTADFSGLLAGQRGPISGPRRSWGSAGYRGIGVPGSRAGLGGRAGQAAAHPPWALGPGPRRCAAHPTPPQRFRGTGWKQGRQRLFWEDPVLLINQWGGQRRESQGQPAPGDLEVTAAPTAATQAGRGRQRPVSAGGRSLEELSTQPCSHAARARSAATRSARTETGHLRPEQTPPPRARDTDLTALGQKLDSLASWCRGLTPCPVPMALHGQNEFCKSLWGPSRSDEGPQTTKGRTR